MVRTCADILCGMLLVSDKLWHLRHLLHSHDLPPTVPSVNAIDVIQGSKYQVLYYRRIESREELMVLWWMERCVKMMQYNLLREVVVLHAISSSACFRCCMSPRRYVESSGSIISLEKHHPNSSCSIRMFAHWTYSMVRLCIFYL